MTAVRCPGHCAWAAGHFSCMSVSRGLTRGRVYCSKMDSFPIHSASEGQLCFPVSVQQKEMLRGVNVEND